MSARGLVVHQGALTAIEEALASATAEISDRVSATLDQVNAQTAAWTEETPSRQAQREHERRIREGVLRLTEALDGVRAAVAAHREEARAAEVENVAIVG
ncbi:hypothetical protein ACFP3Q_08455 [Nocardioides sp. GCM10027113]|uniref:hypothetical protein n=1 Tax=unclassified Nocardioides TaxID=2615069 RepID=UPI003610D6DD